MRIMKIAFVLMFLMSTSIQSSFADDIQELKGMIEELRQDYETKIRKLEGKIEELQSRQKQDTAVLKEEIKEDIEAKALSVEYVGRHQAPVGAGGLLVRNPFGFGNVSLGGYYDMEYRDLNNAESTFRQHRWVINIGAQIHDRLRFNSEYEIEYGGPNSANGDGEAKVEQAYVDYLINDMINLRAGAVLVPFGRYNLYHDSDLQDLTDRPLLARRVVPTTWTEAAYGLFGEWNPTIGSYEDLVVDYELYGFNGLDSNFSDKGFRDATGSLKTDNNDDKAAAGRLGISPFLGHEVGVSGYAGAYNGDDLIRGIGVDSLNTFGPLELITEYAYFDVEEVSTLTSDQSDLTNFLQGAYAQLNYHFWPEFLDKSFLGRGFEDPTLTLVGRYGWALLHDDSDSDTGDNEETRYTLGFNYRPVESFAVKLEYQWNHTSNETLEAGDGDGFITSVSMGF